MIAKRFRLAEREIARVFRQGKYVAGHFWTVQIVSARSSKIGVSVSKKHDKRAIVRNTYRRCLYDTVRVAFGDTLFQAPFRHYFFSLKKGFKPEKQPSQACIDDIYEVWKRATEKR